MKFKVITIKDHEKSMEAADRCIRSAAQFGHTVEIFGAYTPKDNPLVMCKNQGIDPARFLEKYSYQEKAAAAFLSHHLLWKMCAHYDETYCILEHDAVFVNAIPQYLQFDKLLSVGAPSYGKWKQPIMLGVNPLTSKTYLPGAHAYILKPSGARELLAAAPHLAGPTDVFLNLNNFPWLQEYYPWPVVAKDSFTTIQRVEGCLAKHRYGPEYQIL